MAPESAGSPEQDPARPADRELPPPLPEGYMETSPPAMDGGESSPPLGIIHLLAWTGCCAVALAVSRARMDSFAIRNDPALPFFPVLFALSSLSQGAGLMGLGLAGTRRWRGLSFPNQPGEWLLFIRGGEAVMFYLCLGIYLLAGEGSPPFAFVIVPLVSTVLTVWALARSPALRKRQTGWRFNFLTLTFLNSMETVIGTMWFLFSLGGPLSPSIGTQTLRYCSIVEPLFMLLLLGAAGLADLLRRERRGWVHWFGVAAILWNYTLSAAWFAFNTWFRT